jgi:hypothetical protein
MMKPERAQGEITIIMEIIYFVQRRRWVDRRTEGQSERMCFGALFISSSPSAANRFGDEERQAEAQSNPQANYNKSK